MTVKEIKKTVEQVVRTEYVAVDGEVFYNEEECKKYEESALFAVSKSLKRLAKTSHYALIEQDEDCELEVFDIQTEEDLQMLRQYLYLRCYSKNDVDSICKQITVGHEVLIFWAYDGDYFWVIKDGSINGYCDWIKENYASIVASKEPETKSE